MIQDAFSPIPIFYKERLSVVYLAWHVSCLGFVVEEHLKEIFLSVSVLYFHL